MNTMDWSKLPVGTVCRYDGHQATVIIEIVQPMPKLMVRSLHLHNAKGWNLGEIESFTPSEDGWKVDNIYVFNKLVDEYYGMNIAPNQEHDNNAIDL